MSQSVLIAGGGLAGLTCAVHLTETPLGIRIVEAAPFLGGRASTFRDSQGDWIEQGLHLFLGTYSEFKELLRRVGQPPDNILLWTKQVHIQDAHGGSATYGTNPITSPIKTLGSLVSQNDFISIGEKLGFGANAIQSLKSLRSLEVELDGLTVAQWWSQGGGSRDVLERILRPFCRAIQFTDVEQFSAYNFLGWLHHIAYDLPHSLLGGYRGPRDEIIFRPIGEYLHQRAARIDTSTSLSSLDYDDRTNRIVSCTLSTGEKVASDLYVLAMPAWMLDNLLPEAIRIHPFFERITQLPVAPAVSVQLWLDGRVVDVDDFHLVANSYACVYQEQSTNAYPRSGGSRLSVTISPADTFLTWTDQDLVHYVVSELTKVRPEVSKYRVVKSVVLKHEHHLIRPAPGAMRSRPPQRTPVSNLFLAGDWTQQDYFGSQEGAVRSGRRCAEAIIEAVEK